jgi:thioredoxin-dependent peroxiredoxin
MVSPGEKLALDFPVHVVHAGKLTHQRFNDLLTRRTVVSVHMKNNTATCDRQNEALITCAAHLDRAGFGVVAISRDSPGSHLRYAAAKGIGFALVSDPADQFARAADSLVQKTMYGRAFMGPARAAFVLAADGTMLAVLEKVERERYCEQLRMLLKSL